MKRPNTTRQAVLRARCDTRMKKAIDAIARRRHCDVSDVIREAVALHIERQTGGAK